MTKQLPLAKRAIQAEKGADTATARLKELADASGLDLADEVGWELLADQCEERGEDDAVVRLALSMAWQVVLWRLNGAFDSVNAIKITVGDLKQANSSEAVLRELKTLRQFAANRLNRDGVTDPLLMRSALATVERAQKLHDRLKARGVLRES
jgi:hypothetical protein